MSIIHIFLDCVDGDVDVFGNVVCNVQHETAASLLCWSELFTLPPLSTFLLSDMTKFSLLVDHTGTSYAIAEHRLHSLYCLRKVLCSCIVCWFVHACMNEH